MVVRHAATGIEASAGERRSQHDNLAVAVRRVRVALATGVRVERGPDAPSPLWRSRLRAGRVSCNPEHRDFASLLAEALDVLASEEWDPRPAAARLGLSPTQLVRFVSAEGSGLAVLNRERRSRGLAPLR